MKGNTASNLKVALNVSAKDVSHRCGIVIVVQLKAIQFDALEIHAQMIPNAIMASLSA